MSPRIAKDIRLIAPSCTVTIALMIATTFLPGDGKGWAGMIAVFGCLIVAGSIFGAEFSHGVVPQLLAQPLDRRHIWRQKLVIMVAALIALIGVLLAMESVAWPVAVVAAVAFCTVPYFTLLGRSTIGGIILSIPIPGVLFVAGSLLALWLLRPSGETINENRVHFWVRADLYVVLPAYCAIVFYLGRRRFVSFEVAGSGQPQVRLPSAMLDDLDGFVRAICPTGRRHIRSIIAKELHLQHNSVILFLILTGLQLLAFVYVGVAKSTDSEYFLFPMFLSIGIMPLLIGSSAIAEETNLGTRAWHLTVPCSTTVQWVIKLCTVLIFALLVAVAAPLFWMLLGCTFGCFTFEWSEVPLFVLSVGSGVLVMTILAFYASSISRDTLRALLTSFALCAGVIMVVNFWSYGLQRLLHQPLSLVVPALQNDINLWAVLGLPVLGFLVLLLLSSRNYFAALDRPRVWANVVALLLSPIVLFVILVGVFSITG